MNKTADLSLLAQKRLARMAREALFRAGPYLRYPLFDIVWGIGGPPAGRAFLCLRERKGGFASFISVALPPAQERGEFSFSSTMGGAF